MILLDFDKYNCQFFPVYYRPYFVKKVQILFSLPLFCDNIYAILIACFDRDNSFFVGVEIMSINCFTKQTSDGMQNYSVACHVRIFSSHINVFDSDFVFILNKIFPNCRRVAALTLNVKCQLFWK